MNKQCKCGRPALHKESRNGKIYYRTNCWKCRDIARAHRGKYCQHCGYVSQQKGDVDIDHIDSDRSNNDPSNLQTLCRPCHIEKTKKDNAKKARLEKVSVTTKYCNKCYTTKSSSEFYKHAKAKDGLQQYCKVCQNYSDKIRREKRKANPPTIIRNKKTCKTCKQTKPASQFGLRNDAPDKMLSYCKPCWVRRTQQSMIRNNK